MKDIHINEDATIEEKIHILKSLNKTYPGWLFLPWKIKLKANAILNQLLEEYSFLDKETFSFKLIFENVNIGLNLGMTKRTFKMRFFKSSDALDAFVLS